MKKIACILLVLWLQKRKALEHKIFFWVDLILQLRDAKSQPCSQPNFNQSDFSILRPVFPQECHSNGMKHTLLKLTKLSSLLHHLSRILKWRRTQYFQATCTILLPPYRGKLSAKSLNTFYLRSWGSETKKTQTPSPLSKPYGSKLELTYFLTSSTPIPVSWTLSFVPRDWLGATAYVQRYPNHVFKSQNKVRRASGALTDFPTGSDQNLG